MVQLIYTFKMIEFQWEVLVEEGRHYEEDMLVSC